MNLENFVAVTSVETHDKLIISSGHIMEWFHGKGVVIKVKFNCQYNADLEIEVRFKELGFGKTNSFSIEKLENRVIIKCINFYNKIENFFSHKIATYKVGDMTIPIYIKAYVVPIPNMSCKDFVYCLYMDKADIDKIPENQIPKGISW